MEILGINVSTAVALSVMALAIVEWIKTPTMPDWSVRLIALGVSFGLLALATDYSIAFNTLDFVKMGVSVFFLSTGVFHVADQVGISISKNQ